MRGLVGWSSNDFCLAALTYFFHSNGFCKKKAKAEKKLNDASKFRDVQISRIGGFGDATPDHSRALAGFRAPSAGIPPPLPGPPPAGAPPATAAQQAAGPRAQAQVLMDLENVLAWEGMGELELPFELDPSMCRDAGCAEDTFAKPSTPY